MIAILSCPEGWIMAYNITGNYPLDYKCNIRRVFFLQKPEGTLAFKSEPDDEYHFNESPGNIEYFFNATYFSFRKRQDPNYMIERKDGMGVYITTKDDDIKLHTLIIK
jgi:hypothetical protein